MAAHGLSELNGHMATYFSFSQIPGNLTPRHAFLLEMLIPHLHVSLIRAFQGHGNAQESRQAQDNTLSRLTDRENEILHWMTQGKTNWEIAQVLGLSVSTVKNHVQKILVKLKVNTRAQAVAKVHRV